MEQLIRVRMQRSFEMTVPSLTATKKSDLITTTSVVERRNEAVDVARLERREPSHEAATTDEHTSKANPAECLADHWR